ncbi:unnamed protein product [Withania somnifera]
MNICYTYQVKEDRNISIRMPIHCNNAGAGFTEARADVELKEINFYNPDESIQNKLLPKKKKHGALAVQVTELKCGGIVVACTFDHRVSDAYSFNMFLVSWAELAQFKPLSQQPSFRRSFLWPRCPSYYDPLIDSMYLPISALKQETTDVDHDDQAISRIYYVKADEIRCLQSLANCNNTKFTKLESFRAFIWKALASGMGKNEKVNYSKNIRIGIVVNGRSRLSDGNEDQTKILKRYVGNVLSIPFSEENVGELKENPLTFLYHYLAKFFRLIVACAVHEFLEQALTKEHFLGLIDWVENRRPEPVLARIYSTNEDVTAIVVSSGQQFPVRTIEFGWGEAVSGSYHVPWEVKTGYVMPMPSPKGNGDWIVYIHMLKGQLDLVEANASNVFKPLTSEYLNLK